MYSIVGKKKEGNKVKYICSDNNIRDKDAVVADIGRKLVENATVQVYKGNSIVRVKEVKNVTDNKRSCNNKKSTSHDKIMKIEDIINLPKYKMMNIIETKEICRGYMIVHYMEKDDLRNEYTDVVNMYTGDIQTVANSRVYVNKEEIKGVVLRRNRKQGAILGVSIEWVKLNMSTGKVCRRKVYEYNGNQFMRHRVIEDMKNKIICMMIIDNMDRFWVTAIQVSENGNVVRINDRWKEGVKELPKGERIQSVKGIIGVNIGDKKTEVTIGVNNSEYTVWLAGVK